MGDPPLRFIVRVLLEGRAGGRIAERSPTGEIADWGRVLTWEPPGRVAFTWHPEGGEATEVEVQFIPEGSGATRVELEHRGWERLGPAAGERRAPRQHRGSRAAARHSGA